MRIPLPLPGTGVQWGRVLATLLILLAPAALPPSTYAQTGAAPVAIAFSDPSSSCAFSGASNLTMSFEVPRSGTLSVTVSSMTGTVTTNPTGHRVDAFTVGAVTLSGSNVSSYVVSQSPQTLPTRLTSPANRTIIFAASTAKSTDGSTWGSTSTLAPGQFDYGSGGGLFNTFTTYYRIGGGVSSIRSTTTAATYSASITLTFACT